MKNLLLSVVLLLTVSFSFANNGMDKKLDFNNNIENVDVKFSKERATIILNVKRGSINENYKLDFNSIEDFKNFDENQINFFLGSDVCEVTATVTVSATVDAGAGVVGGSVTVSVTASVTASCAEIANAVKKLKKALLAAIL
jgi:hypothetical protein